MKNNWQERRNPEYISQKQQEVEQFLQDHQKADQIQSGIKRTEKYKIDLKFGGFTDDQLIEIAKNRSNGNRVKLETELIELWRQRANINSRNYQGNARVPDSGFFKALAILESLPDSKIPLETINYLHQQIKITDAEISSYLKQLTELGVKLNNTKTQDDRKYIIDSMAHIRQDIQVLNRQKFSIENKLKSI